MPTFPGSRGSSSRVSPESVSWMRMAATRGCYSRIKRCVRAANSRSAVYPDFALAQDSMEGQRLREVEDAFASLSDRYLGAEPDFTASYRIELDDLGESWAVELDELSCTVTVAPTRDPDVVIGKIGRA